jgi:hypothetical protein
MASAHIQPFVILFLFLGRQTEKKTEGIPARFPLLWLMHTRFGHAASMRRQCHKRMRSTRPARPYYKNEQHIHPPSLHVLLNNNNFSNAS